MKKGKTILLAGWMAFALGAHAQEVVVPGSSGLVLPSGTQMEPLAGGDALKPAARSGTGRDSLVADTSRWRPSLSLPPLNRDGAVAYFPLGYYGGYWGLWGLHEGFNASLDMSVAASFGKHRFPGVGFGTGVSAMYVHSLTDRLVLAAGGFYDRLSWNGFNRNRFGINLMLGYKLTDRLSVYAYGSKAFSPGRGGWIPMPWADNFSSRFGGMLHFKLSDAASISLSVEEARWDR